MRDTLVDQPDGGPTSAAPPPRRIFYAAGPGNVIGTYRHWKLGQDDPSQIAITYSGQFYDAVRDTGATALVVAYSRVPGRLRDGPFAIEHRPVPFETYNGPLYHLGQIWYGLGLLWSARRFRADVAVVCGGTHWFMLSLFGLLGIRTVASVHCTLWRDHAAGKHHRSDLVRHLVRRLDAWFFRRRCDAVLSVSTEVTRQVRTLCAGHQPAQVHTFVPIYRRSAFEQVPPPPRDPAQRRPFRVLFVGRMERNKGIFDLKKIARRFSNDGRTDVEFDLCGDGSALAELEQAVRQAGIAARFRIHGHCDRQRLREMYGAAHVVIAPTHTDFLEGFNKVVVEGVLAGRPVVTSSVCPSLSLVHDAVLEVPPDDVQGYGDAILRLCDDPALYDRMVQSAAVAREQFYDESHSWGQMLRTSLAALDRPADEKAPPAAARRPASASRRPSTRAASRREPDRVVSQISSYGGIMVAAVLGVLAALMGFVGVARDHPLPIDRNQGTAPRHLQWSHRAGDAKQPTAAADAATTAARTTHASSAQ